MNTKRPDIWFVGDPHGEFRRIVDLAVRRKPDAIILLGDLELPAPFEEVFGPVLKHGKTVVRFIHGNHDCDTPELWERLSSGPIASKSNLHGRIEHICGFRIAGLGGIFRSRIWMPPSPPVFEGYAEFETNLEPWWWTDAQRTQHEVKNKHQRLTHRASIFHDVYLRLADREADILVTHEAPGGNGGHCLGYPAIRDLASLMRAKAAWHGHHHEFIRYELETPCRWTGVGKRQIVDLDGKAID